ncbi:hypothetical protein FRX31_034287 [Thalictrum thalictroides]|uniref:Uncharacterized protein n=1 Tax=Thalictrum thalictroides TaxID=46969 RepID=A0A7J6UV97_THATH|nr:hypothetical protein FRX31_034287 [Thalictrum thalictroides]
MRATHRPKALNGLRWTVAHQYNDCDGPSYERIIVLRSFLGCDGPSHILRAIGMDCRASDSFSKDRRRATTDRRTFVERLRRIVMQTNHHLRVVDGLR